MSEAIATKGARRADAQRNYDRLLSVARAAQVAALIAVQDVTQFDDKSRSVIFGNCGTVITAGNEGGAISNCGATSAGACTALL